MYKLFALVIVTLAPLFAEFETATLRLEHNVTDNDLEVVIEAKEVKEGLVKLTLIGPQGQKKIDLTSADSQLGLRHFSFETPEPKDLESIKKAYPEGEYQFLGETVSGAKISAKSTFSHSLVEAPQITYPKADQEGVALKNLKIEWTPLKNVVGYLLSIEQLNSEIKFSSQLPANTTSFVVPEGFLKAGAEYSLGIGAIGQNRNTTYVEVSFTTEGK